MQSPNVRKAVGYRRVSSRSQADNFSLRSQDRDIREYCEQETMLLILMFTDVGSGLSAKHREGFLQLHGHVLDPANGITDVVFWDLDRFTRNIEEFFLYTKELINKGITLHLAVDGEKYDYNSEERWHGRLIAAQAESKRISRRTKRGQREATELGHHIGKPPWGYRLVHDSDDPNEEGERSDDPNEKRRRIECGRLEPDPEKWDDCLKFWELASKDWTPMQIARYMNQHDIPAPNGGEWTDGAARYIMKNRTYHGRGYRGVNPQSRLPGPKENAPPIIVEDSHQAAVSIEEFERINEGIRKRHRSQGPTRSHSSPNPLSGQLKCGPCWVREYDSNLELHRQDGKVRVRCARKKKKGDERCTFKTPRLAPILEAITERLIHHFLTKETLDSIVAGVAEHSRRFLEEQESSKSGISARKKVVEDEINNITAVLTASGAKASNLHSLIDKLEKLEKEKKELQRQTDRIAEVSEEALLFVNHREGIIETALNRKTYTDPDDPEAIRQLMKIFIDRVEVFEGGYGTIHYDLPARSLGLGDVPASETIYFEKRKGTVAPESCGLAQSMGIDRV